MLRVLYNNRYVKASMPIPADHHARRAQVVAVALRLIAKAGLEAVTVRDVAAAAGFSTAIVSHYFRNKMELLHLCYQATIDHSTARWEAALVANDGDLRAYLAEIMPLDEERFMEWRIWMAFWAKAATDEAFAAIQRDCVARARGRIHDAIDALHERGAIRPEVDRPQAARHLLALITGMSVQVMFDAEDWSNERQHEVIDSVLRPLYRPSRLPAALREDGRAEVA
jgi:AcrR family transcriptional regulator